MRVLAPRKGVLRGETLTVFDRDTTVAGNGGDDQRMSISTLLGFLFGVGLFVGAIALSTDNFIAFVSLPSIVLVGGGTLASAFIGYQARYVILALRELPQLLVKPKIDRRVLTLETGKIIRWGYLVKKHGILELEREIKAAKNRDQFLNFGVNLVITGYRGDEVRPMLMTAAESKYQRTMVNSDILRNMASTAPALRDDWHPGRSDHHVANARGRPRGPFEQRAGIQRFRDYLVTEGFSMLADHKSPRFSATSQGLNFEFKSTGMFALGSADFLPEAEPLLDRVAQLLSLFGTTNFNVEVEGHTDDVPINTTRFPSNWELSSARATSVVRFFIERGIDPTRLRATGYADTRPKAPNLDDSGRPIPANRELNRRIVIRVDR